MEVVVSLMGMCGLEVYEDVEQQKDYMNFPQCF